MRALDRVDLLNQANLKSVKVLIPCDDEIKKYNCFSEHLFADKRRIKEESKKNQRRIKEETQTLAEIRDSLLTKLISGEIRVPIEVVQ